MAGRKANKADQKFSQWLKAHGFDDIKTNTRADAMWWAGHAAGLRSADTELTHPAQLRKWFNEQEKTSSLPEDLQQIDAEKVETIELDQRSTEKVAKVINRAKSGDEGSETAKRHAGMIYHMSLFFLPGNHGEGAYSPQRENSTCPVAASETY
ncbi:hypothetical protein GO608_015405 [Aromatoleum buckelii]|nr:hypothetical protein [Aromatoleum buckelii]